MAKPFEFDIKSVRNHARESLRDGPVTEAYGLDREQVVESLNDVLATEVVCSLRYRYHYYVADGIHGRSVAGELLEHANEESQHADWVAERITQLGGKPQLDPAEISRRSHVQYQTGSTLIEMLREDLIAERIAIETYSQLIRWLGDKDPTTRRLMERILRTEEEHATDLTDFLARFPDS